MQQPILTIIAGCNGSGKSSYANALSPNGITSFDYDKEYLSVYNSLRDSEYRERMAHNSTYSKLEQEIKRSIEQKNGFTYETNFNHAPLFWAKKFKEAGYKLILYYFCLDSIDEAKRRVQIRVENGGHYVPHNEIEERYFSGFRNLNEHWSFFDTIVLYDTSIYNAHPRILVVLDSHKILALYEMESYVRSLLPNLPF